MGKYTPPPFWQRKNGHWVLVKPEPVDYSSIAKSISLDNLIPEPFKPFRKRKQ